jgi:hypothetical protein
MLRPVRRPPLREARFATHHLDWRGLGFSLLPRPFPRRGRSDRDARAARPSSRSRCAPPSIVRCRCSYSRLLFFCDSRAGCHPPEVTDVARAVATNADRPKSGRLLRVGLDSGRGDLRGGLVGRTRTGHDRPDGGVVVGPRRVAAATAGEDGCAEASLLRSSQEGGQGRELPTTRGPALKVWVIRSRLRLGCGQLARGHLGDRDERP